ncbi:acyl-CoA carboxylase subunit beta [Euzebya tangerina]|uniref:acyl-CoA carboxylase subunit beta n=1 Tax=Euzebya tangerina TaxID=591198 RepID=UPI000E31B41E|nr:carboxyl transferase domain-containing protein [Euzebya tangerina]
MTDQAGPTETAATLPTMKDRLAELERRRQIALGMGGEDRIARHHASGRLTARERITALLDDDSFYEIGMLAEPERRLDRPVPGDGCITGFGRLDGRKVCLIAIDATTLAGTTAPISMRKQGRIAEFAATKGLPLILLMDADGGRIPDVMGWRFSGLPFDFSTFLQTPEGYPPIPRIAAMLGPGYGDSALHAGTAHIVIMTESSSIALVGPTVVASAIGEVVSDEELGGPAHAQELGTAHLALPDEQEVFDAIAAYLSYFPSNASRPAPLAPAVEPRRPAESLLEVVPTNPKQAYDMVEVLDAIVDADTLLPWRPEAGKAIIAAFARIGGQPIGVIASQPRFGAGALDPKALEKAHTFVDLCDTFNLPLVYLQDVPGLLVGIEAERQGIVAWYERLVARMARTKVPNVAVVVRKAFGGGHYALGGRPTNPDLLVCWPTAELGFMAPDTGIVTVNRRRLEAAEAEGGIEARRALEAELSAYWADESEPWEAAAHTYVDDIIDPRDTRKVILTGIEFGWGDRDRVG